MGLLERRRKKKAAKLYLEWFRVTRKTQGDVNFSGEYLYKWFEDFFWENMAVAEREKMLEDLSSLQKEYHCRCDFVYPGFVIIHDPKTNKAKPLDGRRGSLYIFGQSKVGNTKKEAKKEFSELNEILRANIIELVLNGFESKWLREEHEARLRRMDDSNKGLGLNRSGNARFTDTWRVGTYSFTCTVEYWASEDTANASWFVGTDKKIGGASIPCYAIKIKIDPMPEYDRLQEIHGWIRQVRPFKGHFGPGDISQHWKTKQTGQEEEILKEIHPCLLYGFAGVRYEKERAVTSAIERKAQEKITAWSKNS